MLNLILKRCISLQSLNQIKLYTKPDPAKLTRKSQFYSLLGSPKRMWVLCAFQKMGNSLYALWSPFFCSYYKLHKMAKQAVLAFLCQAWLWGCFKAGSLGAWVPPMRSTTEVPIKAMPPPARAVNVGSGSCSSWDSQISGLIPAWEVSLLILASSAFLFSGIFPAMSLSLHTYKKKQKCFFSKPFRVPRASLIARLVKNPPAMQETPVWSLSQEDPLVKG